jgi:hypothetical protein
MMTKNTVAMMKGRVALLTEMTGVALTVDKDSGGYRLKDAYFRNMSPRLTLTPFIGHLNALIDGAALALDGNDQDQAEFESRECHVALVLYNGRAGYRAQGRQVSVTRGTEAEARAAWDKAVAESPTPCACAG